MDRILVLNIQPALLEQRKTSSSTWPLVLSPISLLSLPNELITEVFKLLTILDRTHLALTCKQLAAYGCLPGVLNLNPNLGQDSDRALIKTDDSLLTLRLGSASPLQYKIWYFSFDGSKTWDSRSISPNGKQWNRIVKRHLAYRGIRHTIGVSELIVARKNIMMDESGGARYMGFW